MTRLFLTFLAAVALGSATGLTQFSDPAFTVVVDASEAPELHIWSAKARELVIVDYAWPL